MKSSFLSNNLRPDILSNKSVSGLSFDLLRYGLALILAVAGAAKLVDASALLSTLQQIPFLNEGLITWIATLLPVVELVMAVALFVGWKPYFTMPAILGLFAIFLAFSIYGLYTNMTGGCGCFGSLAESSFGWGMVLRNLVFMLLSGYLLIN